MMAYVSSSNYNKVLSTSYESSFFIKIFHNAVQGQTHVLVPENYFYKIKTAPAT